MAVLDTSLTLAELVTAHPELAAELDRQHVDYCSMGKRTISMVCTDRGMEPALFTARLEPLLSPHGAPDWAHLSAAELCEHVVDTHHRLLWTELPRLGAALEEVATRQRRYVPWLTDASSCFDALRHQCETHLTYEERVLFPAIIELARTGELPHAHCRTLAGQFSATRREHDHLFQLFDLLRRVVRNSRNVTGEDETLVECALAISRLESDTRLHVHKENNVLYPAVASIEEQLRQARNKR